MAIIQGEGLELSEVPREEWNGGTHPGRLRFQTFRPRHGEPLTDALIGQGMMSLGGGGYGGGGLPYPSEVLAALGRRDPTRRRSPTPAAPTVLKDDGSGEHQYALIAVGAAGPSHRGLAGRESRAGWRRSAGTASPAPMPTSSSATARRSPARCASKGRKRNGRTGER